MFLICTNTIHREDSEEGEKRKETFRRASGREG
jgi:hypothetical protein